MCFIALRVSFYISFVSLIKLCISVLIFIINKQINK